MKACRGFTLVELAMVLFIVSLLLGGLLVPLATQIEARQRSDAEEQLERIREALIGFAIINGRFPCHTTTTDPASASFSSARVRRSIVSLRAMSLRLETCPVNRLRLSSANNRP